MARRDARLRLQTREESRGRGGGAEWVLTEARSCASVLRSLRLVYDVEFTDNEGLTLAALKIGIGSLLSLEDDKQGVKIQARIEALDEAGAPFQVVGADAAVAAASARAVAGHKRRADEVLDASAVVLVPDDDDDRVVPVESAAEPAAKRVAV